MTHYHVHVLRGDDEQFVRGLTVNQTSESRDSAEPLYQVWDDVGEFGEANRCLSEPLPLAEALRRALAITAQHIAEPFTPLLGAAPFELLGYRKRRRIGRSWLFFPRYERLPADINQVGTDGLPKRESSPSAPQPCSFEAMDLAKRVEQLVGSGRARAHYAADERLQEVHGASRILSIAVLNSDVPRRPRTEADALLTRIAEAGAAWLGQHGLLVPGTLLSILWLREVDLIFVSWTWGAGGRAFWIDSDGRPTPREPSRTTGPNV